MRTTTEMSWMIHETRIPYSVAHGRSFCRLAPSVFQAEKAPSRLLGSLSGSSWSMWTSCIGFEVVCFVFSVNLEMDHTIYYIEYLVTQHLVRILEMMSPDTCF